MLCMDTTITKLWCGPGPKIMGYSCVQWARFVVLGSWLVADIVGLVVSLLKRVAS